MTYEELKNVNLLLYKVAKKRQAEAGNTTSLDNLSLTADRDSGGFGFGRSPEGSDFWRSVVLSECDIDQMGGTTRQHFKRVELIGLAILITEANDKETWEYIITKAKELLQTL